MQHRKKGEEAKQCRIIADVLGRLKIDGEALYAGEVHGAICDKESQSAFLYTITPSDRALHIVAYRKFPASAMERMGRARAAIMGSLRASDAPCSRWKVFISYADKVPCICMEAHMPLGARDWHATDLMGRKLRSFFSCIRSILPHAGFARF